VKVNSNMAAPPVPKTYYHMSGKEYALGKIICANGQEKLPAEFEEPLERYRPPNLGPRRDFVYCRPNTIFDRCGIVSPKYIYRVEPTGKQRRPQVHDLGWIGPMQLASVRQKYKDKLPEGVKRLPQWTDELVERCCKGYWSGGPANDDDPVWEYLFPCVRVIEVVSDQPVDPRLTKSGWPPPMSK
jgi:hypothetical protein